MTLSFIVIAYNEEETISELFSELKAQDYPHEKMEIILVDSGSQDKTRELMQRFSKEKNGFSRVVVKENPEKTLPCGWNVALKESKGEVLLRVDAHASIPKDFVSKNIRCQQSGEKVCGGYRPNIIDEETPWKKTLLMAETSMFGSSAASYRRNGEKRYVSSVFHGAYRREVFDKVGGYNERLTRTEDNEMHYRIRQAGYRICFDPEIISYEHTRNSLKKMLRQKYLNGLWIGLTAGVCPKCLSLFHFVPFAFVLAIAFTTVLALCKLPLLSLLMWAAYWLLAAVMAVAAVVQSKSFHPTYLLLPLLFFLLHLFYGAGTLVGIVKLPFWKRKNQEKESRS